MLKKVTDLEALWHNNLTNWSKGLTDWKKEFL